MLQHESRVSSQSCLVVTKVGANEQTVFFGTSVSTLQNVFVVQLSRHSTNQHFKLCPALATFKEQEEHHLPALEFILIKCQSNCDFLIICLLDQAVWRLFWLCNCPSSQQTSISSCVLLFEHPKSKKNNSCLLLDPF